MRARLLMVCLLGGAPAVAQPEVYGPRPRLGIANPPLPLGAVAHRLSPAGDGLILSYLQGGNREIELRWIRLDAAGWGEPHIVAKDGKMLANWADVPAVVEGGDGAMYAHWLSPTVNTAEWYDIRVLRSGDGGETWTDLGTLNDDGVQAEHGFVSYRRAGDHPGRAGLHAGLHDAAHGDHRREHRALGADRRSCVRLLHDRRGAHRRRPGRGV
jgi:hypothetical protein